MSHSLAPWRSHIARALHHDRAKPHSRYVQLATISPEGLPTNRTVVFRGFLTETNQLQFISWKVNFLLFLIEVDSDK
jgi:pyridoxamine 5'-phosphate oxidase